ncbi:hypothetical protein ASPWEDRAFT_141841 [Aspergillus wentii DTO 134E9]|uniref:C3H1-type domain-containing protein n=1 Tax=Aspergillus wentii DTO 134E9 TaxID=1073089 RepID=A0A1L9R9A4_ASPWE|nr:uncharacterized protein ASPWEDRAFT_141841 [Aspergillus wentii DTO 134E9]KAI9926452.1 hypothetical protein MW887_004217 [Aspergillus wentii]OJJ31511.1 hypothetical protein ASPWEDRAFT_141841 [Aspergillus wentii DTO 134E9]
MQFSEAQAAEVKAWVVRKLEDISDADSDVLADYVLALIRSDAPDDEIRKASVENLEDFLREHTAQFVDELFSTFTPQKEAPPSAPQPQTQPQLAHDISHPVSAPQQPLPFNPLSGPPKNYYGSPMGGPHPQGGLDGANFNRKRSYHEGFQADQELQDAPHNRTFKTPRRGRGGGRGDWMGRDGRTPSAPLGQYPPPSGGFPMPSAFPPFDQNDPMAAMMALQSMGFPQMPGMPMPMPPTGAPGQQQPDQMAAKSTERCPFYETQGICYLGATCPYQHDMVPGASKDDEYDPKSSNIMTDGHGRDGGPRMRGSDRGRGRGRGDRGGFGPRGRRSEFSAAGPNDDTSITTIVVEQIPDDKLDDASVREFFSQYGEIVELSLQPQKKLALITYDSHAAAKQAWSSPKVIFDNRFVKVYWHKPRFDKNGGQGGGDEGPAFNQEEFEKQQEEAQKAYEEKMQKRRETEEAKQALERQRDELLKKQQEEKERLLQRLGDQGASNGVGSTGGETAAPADENASDQTKQLRAQLAALEAEAKTLGIDPNAESSPFAGRGRGRGFPGYRGRGGFPPRGRGYDPSFRGGFRGRGMGRGRGGVLRLDNRPRRVAVSGVEFNSDKDEALRQFLIGVGEYESIEPNPEQQDSLIVAFKERYQAERFMFGSWTIPSVGEVQLTWVPNPPITAPTTPGAVSDTKTGSDEDTAMDNTTGSLPPDQLGAPKDGNHDVDYDVADMDDSWGVE